MGAPSDDDAIPRLLETAVHDEIGSRGRACANRKGTNRKENG